MRIQKITHIINCAAYTNVDQAEIEEKQAYLVNAVGPHNLGIAGRRHGADVPIFQAIMFLMENLAHLILKSIPATPIGAYGISKLTGEVKLSEEHSRSCVIELPGFWISRK